METLSVIKAAILDGTLRPDEAPLAEEILEKHGVETFLAFLSYRHVDKEAQQALINKQLGLPASIFSKHSH